MVKKSSTPASAVPENQPTSNALTIISPLTRQPVIVVSEGLMNEVVQLEVRKMELGPVTEANLPEADLLLVDCHKKIQMIEKARAETKAPILEAGRMVDKAIEGLTTPLKATKQELLNAVSSVRDALAAKKAEADRLAAEQKAKAQRELEELQRKNAPPAMVQQAAAKVELATEQQQNVEIFHEAPKPTVQKTTVTTLVIVDPSKIPYTLGGLVLMTPIEKNITALLKAGLKIEGCELKITTENKMGRT